MSRIDEGSLRERLTELLGLPVDEALAYLDALKRGSLGGESGREVTSLARRGMLIKSTDEKSYLPVHPRLALSNLFRSLGDRSTPEMRERRKKVDRLTAELIVLYESRGNRE